jgi:hypothetical protein
MPAYLLIVLAVLSRLLPHPGWMNFTAVTGALLYFGARRSWREMAVPLAALMATDYVLTVFVYRYPFAVQGYLLIWAAWVGVMALGWLLLRSKTSVLRVAAGALAGPTLFWLLSNFAVWAGGTMYPLTSEGFRSCYIAAIPFYRNDLVSTAIVVGVAFGVPALLRRMNAGRALQAAAR